MWGLVALAIVAAAQHSESLIVSTTPGYLFQKLILCFHKWIITSRLVFPVNE